jgi:hypothetical protein
MIKRREHLLHRQRWSLAEVRALTGWNRQRLWRWLRTHGLRGKWVYADQVRKLTLSSLERGHFFREAQEEKCNTAPQTSEGKQGVAPDLDHEGTKQAPDRPKLKPHDDAYFHRQHFIAGLSLRKLADLHDLTRKAVDFAIRRHGKRLHDAQVAEMRAAARDGARRATGS